MATRRAAPMCTHTTDLHHSIVPCPGREAGECGHRSHVCASRLLPLQMTSFKSQNNHLSGVLLLVLMAMIPSSFLLPDRWSSLFPGGRQGSCKCFSTYNLLLKRRLLSIISLIPVWIREIYFYIMYYTLVLHNTRICNLYVICNL